MEFDGADMARLADVATTASRSSAAPLAEAGSQALQVARDRPTLMLAGAVSSGKSTLANALLRTQAFSTGAGGVTMQNESYTWPRAQLPASGPGRHVASHWTILDTAGYDGAGDVDPAGTADSYLLCVNGQPSPADVSAAWSAGLGGPERRRQDRQRPVMLALTRADELGSGSRPETLAGDIRDDLHPLVTTVLPVSGLYAEACEVPTLRQSDWELLRRLMAVWGPGGPPAWSLHPQAFTGTGDIDLTGAERTRLLQVLGLTGVREVMGFLATTPQARTLDGVHRLLRRRSMIDGLTDVLCGSFLRRTQLLRRERALSDLRRAAMCAHNDTILRAVNGISDRLLLEVRGIARLLAQRPSPLRQSLENYPALRHHVEQLTRCGLPPCSPSEGSQASAQWKSWGHAQNPALRDVENTMIRIWSACGSGRGVQYA